MSNEDGKVFTFCWKIVNFSLCPLQIGEKLTSPEFSAEVLNKTKWRLELYPKGANKLCADCISCFLHRHDEDEKNISISYKLEVIGLNGQILQSYSRFNEQVVKGRGVGSFTFIERKQLLDIEGSEIDILMIRCHIIKHDFEEQRVKCVARTEIEMEKFTFRWKVQMLDSPGCSKKISALYQESTQFDVILTTSDESKIHIKVQKAAGLVQLYKIEMSVFDDNGEKLELRNDTKPENDSFEYSFLYKTQMLVESLGSSSYFSFLIKCDISTPIGSMLSRIESYDFENVLDGIFHAKVRPTFQDNLRDMLLKEKHCDVRLRAGDLIIPVHKSILSVRSPVFSAMFDQDMAENRTGIVDILEVDGEILQSFLEFLYTDTLNNTNCEHVLKLTLVADRYQVPTLKERCSPILMSKMSVENVTDVMYVADLINHQKLKMFALDFIKANKHTILSTSDWSEWVEKNTKLAIQILSKLSIH